jgi:hypothetical protein
MADQYRVRVRMKAGPFQIDDSQESVISATNPRS